MARKAKTTEQAVSQQPEDQQQQQQPLLAESAPAAAAAAPAAPADSTPPAAAPPPAEKAGVLNIPITADGGPAWDTMRPSTRERVMAMISKAGVSLDDHKNLEGFRAMSPMLWGMVSTLTTWGMTRRLVHGEDDVLARQIAKHCSYSEAEQEALAEPTAAMLAKYAPIQTKWAVEINFATVVLTVHAQKFIQIQGLIEAYTADKRRRIDQATAATANAAQQQAAAAMRQAFDGQE